jgi:hypothetical protein
LEVGPGIGNGLQMVKGLDKIFLDKR